MKSTFESSSTRAATALPPGRWLSAMARASTLALSWTLGACGGGGGDPVGPPNASAPVSNATPGTSPTPTPTSGLTQGRWVSTNLAPAYTAIVVPAAAGASSPAVDTLWAVSHDGSSLIKLKAQGGAQTAGAVSGKVYRLGTSSVTAVTGASYALSAGAGGNANAQQMSLQPVLGTTAVFDRTDAMSGALRAEQAHGRWTANFGAVVLTWTVQGASSAGVAPSSNISGTSTSGCVYSGQSTVVSTQSLYRVQFTETCPGPAASTQTFVGVATLTPDDVGMTVVATDESEARATVLVLVRQR